MAVNYVKGQILSGILERDGIDIAIANANVGINTISPAVALDVYGNINANNLSITGNVNGGNLNISANVAAGNILTDNLLYANGTPWDLQEPAGANTEIQFNNNSQFGATANFTFDTAGNLLTVNATANIANINVAGVAVVQGNVTGGNLLTNGLISAAGNITSGNLTIANTTIVATSANSTVTLQPTGTGLVTINTTTGLVIPVGNTAQRPSPGTTGTIRFNTESSRVEVYDGTEWDTIVGGVTNQTLNGNGTATTFTLDRSTTTAAALVMLNGITQVPDQSYSMSPSPSTNLVFTEAPATGDIIDIRFL